MIQTVADLLDELRAKEQDALARYGEVGHQGMIGDMYEGLTRSLLEKGLFTGLDLRVVTGKVRLDDGIYSRQIDAMVVLGEGERMPYSEHLLYAPDQVIAVIEVKKTLYSDALDESYQNLLSLRHQNFLRGARASRLKFAYRRIADGELPDDMDLSRLPWEKEMIAHALMWDVALPVRVVFGYGGYKSEKTLRDGFVDYLNRVLAEYSAAGGAAGYGPASLPSLIISGHSSLVKLNAMPYSVRHNGGDGSWLVYGSYRERPGLLLLELLWTRLASLRIVPVDVFGDDMDLEAINPLLYAKPHRTSERGGWLYELVDLSNDELREPQPVAAWAPTPLTDAEAVLMMYLCQHGSLDTSTDEFWRDYSQAHAADLDSSLSRLRLAGIAAVDHQGILRLLTEQCAVVCHPQLGYLAGENSTGRLTRWVARDIQERNAQGPLSNE
jgi:hypothetical protein